ncbi:MAG: 16S rRNA (cytosine(1402)-N(4))-methyltransferase [Deltaproteobacteria bacterium RBG_13_49_15]|nr:MAG: 16S rRNA (cytosine(1402)-N(4))-methyltransferase [Deltaproteobacteria bacterium RBG_13_49_15]
MPYQHVPVMTKEVIFHLNPKAGQIIVDGTLGGGGHAKEIIPGIAPNGILIGIDLDQDAIEHHQLADHPNSFQFHLFQGNFIHLPDYLKKLNIPKVNGILLDLGISFHQLEFSGRGFSFRKDEPLDMRMDIRESVRAEDLVNDLDEKALVNIFREYGEERYSRPIAKQIVKSRKKERIQSSRQLSEIITSVVRPAGAASRRIHPATRVFMALRIAVNRELENLATLLDRVPDLLTSGGRLCVISFHSLEDRIVKKRFKALEKPCTCPPDFPTCVCGRLGSLRILTKKPIRPGPEEIRTNPMARSAKLRAAERR